MSICNLRSVSGGTCARLNQDIPAGRGVSIRMQDNVPTHTLYRTKGSELAPNWEWVR